MKKTYIFLTGGLGNQLFQMAAALSLGQKTEIVLDVSSGNPRNGSHEIADMFSIFSGAEVSTEKKKKNALSTKIGGYVLRSASEPRGIEKKKFYQVAVRLVASIYFSILYFEFIAVKANVGVGYSEVKISSRLNTFLFGYFQSFRWADFDFVREFMNSFQVQNPSSKFNGLLAEMRTVQPVIMHIRRGDYAFEPNFGVLSQSYYENGLEHLRKLGIKQEVWVFTDDPDWARSLTRSKNWADEKIKLVDDSELSTGEVFDLMRSGSGYVIANSSFSWWAAYLSRVNGACVVAPQPWFVGLPEPSSLIPVSWKRLSGFEPKS
jgi:hypothetical protein